MTEYSPKRQAGLATAAESSTAWRASQTEEMPWLMYTFSIEASITFGNKSDEFQSFGEKKQTQQLPTNVGCEFLPPDVDSPPPPSLLSPTHLQNFFTLADEGGSADRNIIRRDDIFQSCINV